MATFIEKTIDINGTVREYYLHHPLMPTGNGPIPRIVGAYSRFPVIMAFHGGTPSVKRDAMTELWDCVADNPRMKDEIIVICPKSEFTEKSGVYAWQHDTPDTKELPLRDLNFIGELLDLYQADPAKTYATGFSSGAGMTWQLLYVDQLVDHFVGYSMVSQAANYRKEELGDVSALKKAKPIIYIHGTADDNCARNTDPEDPNAIDKMPPDMMRDIIVRNNTKTTPDQVEIIATDRDMAPVEQFFAPKTVARPVIGKAKELPVLKPGAPFCFVTLLNTTHNWSRSGGTPSKRITTFSATAAIFNFWTLHTGLITGPPPVSIILEDC